MPQIAAEVLGVDPATVTMVLGDTDLPVAGPTYRSSSTVRRQRHRRTRGNRRRGCSREAVYHATGKPVRRLPIRPEDLLDV